MADPLAGAQPGTVPWDVIVVPGLARARSFFTSPGALVTTPRGDGDAVAAPPEDRVVVVALVDAEAVPLVDPADVPGRGDEDPHPATEKAIAATEKPTPTTAKRLIGAVRLDRRENICHAVCWETQTRAKPALPHRGAASA